MSDRMLQERKNAGKRTQKQSSSLWRSGRLSPRRRHAATRTLPLCWVEVFSPSLQRWIGTSEEGMTVRVSE